MRYSRLVRASAALLPAFLLPLISQVQAEAVAGRPSQPAATPSRPAALSPDLASSLKPGVTNKVIVVLSDQLAALPATPGGAAKRLAGVKALQRGVVSQLAASHARNVRSFTLVNAVAATVSGSEARTLAATPGVAQVLPDLPIPLAPSGPRLPAARPSAGITPLPGACAAKGKVQLDPEALGNIHAAGSKASAQGLGYTGAGVKVGFIADGVDINNPDFIRANGSHVFVDYQDFSGTGTNAPTSGGEAFLDSSSIGAQGRHTYNVAGYGIGLTKPCDIRILGVAPGASLVGLNVFGSSNFAFGSVFLEAINWAVMHDHVNVLNESFGANPYPDQGLLDLTRAADDAAVKAGVVVTASSGDAGVTNTLGSPATDPAVLSAGASTTYRAYAQTGIGGITAAKGWLDNNISGLSSAGFNQSGGTVDIVAPGDLNWALCTPKPALFSACTNFANQPAPVELSGGTSEAAPLTAGTAALVIQAFRKTHHGATPSPAVVKRIIVSTARNIDAPAEQQGAGLLDAYQAVLAAASFPGGGKPAGHAVLDSPTQLTAVAQPGTTEKLAETLTNDGSSAVKLRLSSRTLSAYHAVSTQTLALTTANSDVVAVPFTVAKGQARLNVAATLAGTVSVSVFAPNGDLAEFNLPEGPGDYGDAQVADPAAGKWTAVVATTPTPSTPTSVTAHFQASTASWRSFGKLSASSVTLAPGKSKAVTLTVPTPAHPGDQSGSILVHSGAKAPSFTTTTSVPVTLRSLIPAPNPTTSLTATLTGGNGRASDTGQTFYYQVDVPSGLKALNASVTTPDSRNTMFAALVDPAGAAQSTAGSDLVSSDGSTLTPENGAQLHVLNPVAGRWTLLAVFYNALSGTAATQPVHISLTGTPATASASGLPDSASTTLPAGTPVTVDVKVTNHGTTPEAYFTDARLSGPGTAFSLAPQTSATLSLPDLSGAIPTYLVPSHTTDIAPATTSAKPVFFDFTWAFGDPDLISSFGTTATGDYPAPDGVANGDWTVTPFLAGPTGASPAPATPATTSVKATTASFDPAVNSTTGDLWLRSLNTAAAFTPVVVNPGASATIPVTITPQGASGTAVTGTLYLSAASLIPGIATYNLLPNPAPQGSDVAAFPYSYTIK